MTQQYKLSYFAFRGLAEPIRLLFALGDIAYEDHRLDADDVTSQGPERWELKEWIALKGSDALPFGQVPILTIGAGDDSVVLSQSQAIIRYVAREHGYFGKNSIEGALIDSVAEHVRDAQTKLWSATTDDAKAEFFDTYRPKHLEHLNRFIQAHSTSANKSTCVGSSISMADIMLFNFFSTIAQSPAYQKLAPSAPHVFTVYEAVANQPRIKAWVEKRPVTNI